MPISRFLQNPQELNPYVYCSNNPLKYTDPTGNLFGIDDALIAGYIGSVLASPDLPSDMQSLATSGGAFLNAPSLAGALDVALDVAGIAVPGVPGSALKKGKDVAVEAAGKIDDVVDAAKGYSHLSDAASVGAGKSFTKAQKANVLEANIAKNSGVLRSDKSGVELVKAQKHVAGVIPPANEAHIDHIYPKSLGGSNSYSNAQVLSREENRRKRNIVQ